MAKLNMVAIFLMLLFVSTAKAHPRNVFDVRKYGAKVDGNSDIVKALSEAFKEACASTTPSRVLIPKGEYTLSNVILQGPCKAAIEIEVQGNLKARTKIGPTNAGSTWVAFQYMDQFTLSGGGIFDGQGHTAWGTCGRSTYCKKLPINMSFSFITNGMVSHVTSKDSKQFHVNVFGCKNFTFSHFTISAPHHSLNTDGIHIGKSSAVRVLDSKIATGDDCVSIGDGSRQITIAKVTCGPGHGISVGSLGKYPNEEPVVGVTIKNCTISQTMNGVRIKTWPASYPGVVSGMRFEDIIMNNVSNPIIVDQVYCPWNQCNAKVPSQVRISNVSIKNIRGTSANPVAMKLSCSRGIPCKGVEIADIDLTYTGPEAPEAISQCSNVNPKLSGKQNPPACSCPAVLSN